MTSTATTRYGTVTVEEQVPFADLREGDIVLGHPVDGRDRTVSVVVNELGMHALPGRFASTFTGSPQLQILARPYGADHRDATHGFCPDRFPAGVAGLDRVVDGLAPEN